jgi:hypothetical protein
MSRHIKGKKSKHIESDDDGSSDEDIKVIKKSTKKGKKSKAIESDDASSSDEEVKVTKKSTKKTTKKGKKSKASESDDDSSSDEDNKKSSKKSTRKGKKSKPIESDNDSSSEEDNKKSSKKGKKSKHSESDDDSSSDEDIKVTKKSTKKITKKDRKSKPIESDDDSSSEEDNKKSSKKSAKKSTKKSTKKSENSKHDKVLPTMTFISPQQKEIIRSTENYKLINGCAGSHKTDTLIKCAVNDLTLNKRPVLFLSLTGSVTFEIKERLETYLSIKINKEGASKHFIGKYNKIPVGIANFNAWVDCTLRQLENGWEKEIDPSQWTKKMAYLLDYSTKEKITCRMKDGTKVGLLIIDEVQDLQSPQMRLLVNLAKQQDLDIYVAGDYLQTLFEVSHENGHAMDIFKHIKNVKYFDLNICMRCPKAHIDFNNILMHDMQIKYKIPVMGSHNDNVIDKPVIFTHRSTGQKDNAHIEATASQITEMIKTLLMGDPDVDPSDIAIIMAKSKDNMLFKYLKNSLDDLYNEIRSLKDKTIIMSTEADGYHKNLDWSHANDKTKMLSIHGDKGKGHKVVFFLGLTEKSIPMEFEVGKVEELLAESKLNVALTRSTKYLFIGFNSSYPSRYLTKYVNVLQKYAYVSWGNSLSCPKIYQDIIRASKSKEYLTPHWTGNYKDAVKIGSKSGIKVHNDLVKDFENSMEVIPHPELANPNWVKHAEKKKFGHNQSITNLKIKDNYNVLGIMSELLIQRLKNKEELSKKLKIDKDYIIYTKDTQFISCMRDIMVLTFEVFCKRHAHLLRSNPALNVKIVKAYENKMIVIHSNFNTTQVKQDIKQFISDTINRKLSPKAIWNTTLFHMHCNSGDYDPLIPKLIDLFDEDISILHQNIQSYYDGYIKKIKKVTFEMKLNINAAKFSQEQLKELNMESHGVGIFGRCDIYNHDKDTMIEIKTSILGECSDEWIIQTLCYVMLMNEIHKTKTTKMKIVNMLKGCVWSWKLPVLPSTEEFVETVSKKYKWHVYEKNELLREINEKRKEILNIEDI